MRISGTAKVCMYARFICLMRQICYLSQWGINVYVCVCEYVCVCLCVCVHVHVCECVCVCE